MKTHRFRAFSTASIAPSPDALPDSIEWMPAGRHLVCCTRDDEPAEVEIEATEADAAKLNEQLQAARKLADEGKASRPFIDFDHEGGEAAAIPVEFFWQDGIRVRVEWTKAGAEAVQGRVYSYFSPEFFADKSGRVTAIPEVGPIGALVNTPAFQRIERLAANLSTTNSEPKMQEIAKALGLPETATEADILAKIAELTGTASTATATTAELATVKAALADTQTKLAASIKAAALAEVERHAAMYEVPESVRPVIADAIAKDADAGRKILAGFQAKKHTPGSPPLKANYGDNGDQLTGRARASAALMAKLAKH
ncbi:MAG TPA: phage protease [Opitutaceae bacterium]|nr:phage protease [Opitutaceae bacterium]